MFEKNYVKRPGSAIDPNQYYNRLNIKDGTSQIATIQVGNNVPDTTPIIKYTIANHLDNSNVMLDSSGALINREEYYPFGETSFGSYKYKRYRYNGKEKDEHTGLYEYGQRYYAPWLCRFVSVDPIADDYPQLSSYNYAGNKPITSQDIEGLQSTVDDVGEGTEATQQSGISESDQNVTISSEIDLNNTETNQSNPEKSELENIVFVSERAKELHAQKYNPVYKTKKDGTVKTHWMGKNKGQPKLDNTSSYSAKYRNFINDLNDKATGKIEIKDGLGRGGEVVPLIDNATNEYNGDFRVRFEELPRTYGGTDFHVLMEELFHVSQYLNDSDWQNERKIKDVTLEWEVQAKEFASTFSGIKMYFENNGFWFPTEMNIMSGKDSYNSRSFEMKMDYLSRTTDIRVFQNLSDKDGTGQLRQHSPNDYYTKLKRR